MIHESVATAAAIVSWALVETITRGKASGLGAASGMVAGLVAVTPACGTIGPMGAILLGVIVSVVAVSFKTKAKHQRGYDDSLDALRIQRPRQWDACWLALELWRELRLDSFWSARLCTTTIIFLFGVE